MSDLDFNIDRIHRLPKPSYLSENLSRDVIFRLQFYHSKEKLMAVTRVKDKIPAQYANLQFYVDLSQFTLLKRRNLNTITKALRNHSITYKWGFPTKLIVTKDGADYTMDSLAKGLALLQSWGITPDPQSQNPGKHGPSAPSQEWHKVNSRNARTHK